ncbi:hypothetical protein PR202_gb28449 [Eleusine coracana subsp. coracana]|uniref:Uncharacterized protein n=1 Tax=Eleusine coracana subsp. coracana TaxID=191504 RepID=A0AAV5FX37_ELECO|nr:hypothetical protein PR202_gb28449 [Eleusine coracana subsp. coracana]
MAAAAAAAAACRRGMLLHQHHHYHRHWQQAAWAGPGARSISQLVKTNGRRAFLVDTLALVRKLESQGVPTKQAEAITSAITEVLNDSLESISESFVSKAEMQKSEMLQESNISKFKSQVQSSQENHFSLLQRETEKLRGDIDKMRSELKYEIDKVTAGQRLDLNLERGRIRDELAKQNEETTELTTKLDKAADHAMLAIVMMQSWSRTEAVVLSSKHCCWKTRAASCWVRNGQVVQAISHK